MKKKTSLFSLFSLVTISTVVFLCACARQNSQISAQTETLEKTPTPENTQTENVNQSQPQKELPTPTVPRPDIVSRSEWKAKDGVGEVKQHTLRNITIHHTASPQNKAASIEKKMQSLQNFAQKEGRLDSGKIKPAWFDVPYHFYIAVDGKIAEGRELKFVGDTNTDYDPTGHALIVLEGNFENEQPSAEQLKSLQELAAWLSTQYKIPVSEIKAHNDYASTACPGKNLKILLPTIRAKVGEIINASESR